MYIKDVTAKQLLDDGPDAAGEEEEHEGRESSELR